MSQIRLFVGDFSIAKFAIEKWGQETDADIVALHQFLDLEDLLNPFNFGKTVIHVIKNPDKDMMHGIEIIENEILKNNFIALCVESVDKRLSFFKNKEIIKCKYLEYIDKEKCLSLIQKLSGFESKICEIIYSKTGYVLVDVENNKGNKVPTKVLNIQKIQQEIEKLKLIEDFDENITKEIISQSKIANSWELIDCIFEGRSGDAIKLVEGTVIDLTHVMMFVGLLISEARLGMLVGSMRSRNSNAVIQKISQIQNNFNYLIDGDDDEKKSKLSVHPYRIYKTINKLKNPNYLLKCVKILKKCEEYNELIRMDIPYQFLIYSLILEIE